MSKIFVAQLTNFNDEVKQGRSSITVHGRVRVERGDWIANS